MAHVLVVRQWERFQHYKDRDPPWIKLYRDTLTTQAWVLGTDLSRLLQVASTMLAARYGNKIPLNYELWKGVAHLDCDEASFTAAIDHLIDQDFLEIQEVEDTRKVSASALLAKRSPETEKSREEQRERRTDMSASPTDVPRETNPSIDDSGQAAARVFAHWRETYGHPRAQMDAKRRKLIRDALRSYSEADLCHAISGYRNSPHHMGQNDRNTVYDAIELLLRDAQHIDAGLKFHAQPPRADLSAKTRQIASQVQDWVPPEMRSAAG